MTSPSPSGELLLERRLRSRQPRQQSLLVVFDGTAIGRQVVARLRRVRLW